MIASNKVDGLGRRYAEKKEILHFGTVGTLIVYLVICGPGYWLMDRLLDREGDEPTVLVLPSAEL